MMPTPRSVATAGMIVTRTEFDAHQHHVDQRFTGLESSMSRGFSTLTDNINRIVARAEAGADPNYGVLLGVITVILTLVSFGAVLVYSTTQHVDELGKARAMFNQERMANTDKRLDAHISQADPVALSAAMESLKTRMAILEAGK